MDFVIPKELEDFNRYGEEYLFGYLGMEFLKVEEDEVIARIVLQQHHFGWNGYLLCGHNFFSGRFVCRVRLCAFVAQGGNGIHHH